MAPASRIFVAREIDSNGDLNGAALFGHALGRNIQRPAKSAEA
jgi:hypothetical protein